MIKLIVFDLGGVLFNGGYADTCKFLAQKFNRDWKELYSVFYEKYFNLAAIRKITQQEAWEKSIEETDMRIDVEELKKIHYSFMSLNFVMVEFVKKLKINYSILTKNTRDQFNDINKILDFDKHFKNIINTWEINLPKASKETILYVCEKFSVKPGEIIYIDDQEENLVDAEELGVKTILYKDFEQFERAWEDTTKQ
jgi:HAD superfamily hydrolase (TIGR01509 family)